jgi:hypothetical protein
MLVVEQHFIVVEQHLTLEVAIGSHACCVTSSVQLPEWLIKVLRSRLLLDHTPCCLEANMRVTNNMPLDVSTLTSGVISEAAEFMVRI